MSRSTAALIIAILVHLLLLLILWILMTKVLAVPPKKPEEQRVKISLQERPPTSKTSAPVKNEVNPTRLIPPMPKGAQLKEPAKPKSAPLPTPQEQIKAKMPEPAPAPKTPPPFPKASKPIPSKPESEPIPSKKPYLPVDETSEANRSDVPEEHQGLFDKLSKKQRISPAAKQQAQTGRQSLISDDIREAYGDAFGRLSQGEKQYLLDHQEVMRRLTQEQLIRTGSTDIPNNLRVNDSNIIEFYLHPNGDMTDFRFVDRSGFNLLDDVTKDTIESVYWKYPRPKQKTLIRYKFNYLLRGY